MIESTGSLYEREGALNRAIASLQLLSEAIVEHCGEGASEIAKERESIEKRLAVITGGGSKLDARHRREHDRLQARINELARIEDILSETAGGAIVAEDSDSVGSEPIRHPQVPRRRVPEPELDEDQVGAVRRYGGRVELAEKKPLSEYIADSLREHLGEQNTWARENHGVDSDEYGKRNGYHGWLLPDGKFLHNASFGPDGTHAIAAHNVIGKAKEVYGFSHNPESYSEQNHHLFEALNDLGWVRMDIPSAGSVPVHYWNPIVHIGETDPTPAQTSWLIKKTPEDSRVIRPSHGIDGGYKEMKHHLQEGGSPSKLNAFLAEPVSLEDWHKGSHPVTKNPDGSPKMLFHGTQNVFKKFSLHGATPENFMGRGIYFTDNPDDAAKSYTNYGPDLKSKIENHADRLVSDAEWDDLAKEKAQKHGYDENLDQRENYNRVIESLKKRHVQNNGSIMPVHVKMENPLHIGGDYHEPHRTRWDYDYEYVDPEDPESDILDTKGKFHDFLGHLEGRLWEESDKGGLENDPNEVMENLRENFYPGDEVDPYQVYKRLGEVAYSPHHGEIFRRAVQDMGYDGIVQHSPDTDFPGMKIPKGTKHYIAFHPTQIKTAFNKGERDPENPRIDMAESGIPSGALDPDPGGTKPRQGKTFAKNPLFERTDDRNVPGRVPGGARTRQGNFQPPQAFPYGKGGRVDFDHRPGYNGAEGDWLQHSPKDILEKGQDSRDFGSANRPKVLNIGNRRYFVKHPSTDGYDGHVESFVYDLAHELGLQHHLVPVHHDPNIPFGKVYGTDRQGVVISPYDPEPPGIPSSATARASMYRNLVPDDTKRMHLAFDMMIGNSDRHTHNYKFGYKGVKLIDHGLALTGFSSPIEHMNNIMSFRHGAGMTSAGDWEIDPKLLKRFVDSKDRILRLADAHKISGKHLQMLTKSLEGAELAHRYNQMPPEEQNALYKILSHSNDDGPRKVTAELYRKFAVDPDYIKQKAAHLLKP